MTLKRWVTRNLQLGVEYSPLAGHGSGDGGTGDGGSGHGGHRGQDRPRADPLRGLSAHKLAPMVSWRLLRERGDLPSIFVGTSMDRIGVPAGQAFYLMLSRDLEDRTGLPLSIFLSPTWSEFDRRMRLQAGASLRFGGHWAFLPIFDGHSFHPMLSYHWDRYALTGILVQGREPGLAFTIGF